MGLLRGSGILRECRLLRCYALLGLHRLLRGALCLGLGTKRLTALNLPSLDGVEEPARALRVLAAIDVKMHGDVLADLQVEFLNLGVDYVKDHTLGVLALFVLDDIRCAHPLVAALACARLNGKSLGYDARNYNVTHKCLNWMGLC